MCGEVDVFPVQAEGFAFAEAGADEEFDQVGEVRIVGVAVVQESDCLGWGPDGALAGGRAWDHGGPDDVGGELVLADGVADGAGEGGEDVPHGGVSVAGGELGQYEVVDVFVGELVQADRAEGRGRVVVDVVAVVDPCGGLEPQPLGREPLDQVGGDGLVRVGTDADPAAGAVAVQGGRSCAA